MITSVRTESGELVTLEIEVDGNALPDEIQVERVEVEHTLNRIPRAEFSIIDGSRAAESFLHSASSRLLPGSDVRIKAGYAGDNQVLFSGRIVRHGLRVSAEGGTLVVSCADPTLALTIPRQSLQFADRKDSDVLSRLIRDAGFKADVPPTSETIEQTVMHDCTPWDFILLRASANGRVVNVRDKKVSVHPPAFSTPKFAVGYGEAIIRLEADLDASAQIPPLKVSAWNPAQQEVLSATSREPALNDQGNVPVSKLDDALGLKNVETRSFAPMAQDALQTWADARQLAIRLTRLQGSVSFPGTARVEPGETLELKGLSDRFNGPAYVCAVTHSLAPGEWTTQAVFGRPPDPVSASSSTVEAPPAAGLRPGTRGIQIAKVVRVDEDPKGQRRIKVTLPLAGDTPVWVRMVAPYASAGSGMVFLPEVGDEVVLAFLDDDPESAVCLGALHSSKRQAPVTPDAENTMKVIRTAGELEIRFDEKAKDMRFSTPGGQVVTLSDENKSVTLQDQHGNSVTLDEAGIALKSPGDVVVEADGAFKLVAQSGIDISSPDDVSLAGANVDVKAKVALKASGSASSELKAGGTTSVSGTLVKIN